MRIPSGDRTARASTRRYLMCRPTYFDAVPPANPQLVALQWQRLHDLYVDFGHTVELIPPVRGRPDMVFTASGAAVLDGRALVGRFRHDERAAESAAYLDWFGRHGFEAAQAAWANAGESDFLAAGGWLLAASGSGTDRRSHAESEEFFGRPVIGLTLADHRYRHLDTALAVLDEQTIAYYPAAFTPGSQDILSALFPDAIIATAEDAQARGLNAVCDGCRVVLPASAVRLAGQLRDRGFEPVGVEAPELLRGGGVKRCTLDLGDPVTARPGAHPGGLSVVVTSMASDSHNWNLVYLQLALEEFGHQVVNLGPCMPDELLVTECLRIRPDLIVVSSVNGHGFRDGMRLIGRIRAHPELAATAVVIGGKLGIAGPGGQSSRDQLKAAGFDAVFEEDCGGMPAFKAFTERLASGVRI